MSNKKGKAGRPKAQIDWNLVEELAAIQCTQTEIAQVLGISERTIHRHASANSKLQRCLMRGREKGKASIRREQFKMLTKGNATMAIWLGKQYLGQRDKTELTGADGKDLLPIAVVDAILDGD